ncbi:hypothetical protein [Candidatus Marithrix sp. Canyon 246]|uniref:hypothetical protein n=1 Tax=Candidatus Marithrix sp. Canyon 246 TaxID=1827136 RepID=UPI001495958B|nr:hypothetical protein [Candidatus Marithrix sp. Canyon 246]
MIQLLKLDSIELPKIPRAIMEFEKKYTLQLTIANKQVINQSVYLQKSNVEFLPAYLQ